MRKFRIARFVLFAIAAVLVLGFVVMFLWNRLMPALFGWHMVSFWQAVGLLLLARILLGGFRGRPGGHWRQRMMERWEKMTPEEREKFREGMGRHGCGPFRQPAAETKA
jgi:hypothetical protein